MESSARSPDEPKAMSGETSYLRNKYTTFVNIKFKTYVNHVRVYAWYRIDIPSMLASNALKQGTKTSDLQDLSDIEIHVGGGVGTAGDVGSVGSVGKCRKVRWGAGFGGIGKRRKVQESVGKCRKV